MRSAPRSTAARAALHLALVAGVLAAAPALAQPQTVLFPGESGATLRASLRAAYRPASLNGDNDDLYSVIDRTNVGGQDGVVCVYTGWFVPFDGVPNNDPSQDVFNGGAGINQEHTWPQSLLPSNAVDNLHNLFPTQVGVNADRGNFRFAEIPDAQTNRWYRGAPPYTQTAIPGADIDEYSELRTGASFEPREDHEGNAARAVFYMATMYDVSTNAAFPFDATDRRTLYDWHYADAIDQAEYDRTFRIAPFQSNEPNPFILDSTLVRRAYFPEILVANEPGPGAVAAVLTAAPSPFTDAASLLFVPSGSGRAVVEAFDALGRRVAALYDGPAAAGVPLALRLDGAALAPGVYVVRAVQGATLVTRRVVRR